jgi:L-asparaginase
MDVKPAAVLPVCHLIATGGTIAMKLDLATRAPVPALSGEDLLQCVPDISKVARLEVHNLCNLPSDHMWPGHWIALHHAVVEALSRDHVAGVMVSHGTDTLEETGWFLDLTVPGDKPVVLVGAQRNASEPDFDGPRNLLNGARVCVSPAATGKGAMLVLNGQINAARDATKTHTSDVESFKSGGFGFLGTVDDDRVVFARAPTRRQHVELTRPELPRVDIVAMYAGADGGLLRAAVELGARGIVVQALGWGNVNVEMHAAIKETVQRGVPVVISTRVADGRVRPKYGFVGGGKTLQDAGAVFADDLSPQKARILLMLALQAPSSLATIQDLFDR